LDSWVDYREGKKYPWWGQNAFHQVAGGWDQEKKKNHELHSLSYKMDLASKKENLPPTLDP